MIQFKVRKSLPVALSVELHGLNTAINSYRFSGLGAARFQGIISKANDSDIRTLMVWTTMWALVGSEFHSHFLKGVCKTDLSAKQCYLS